MAVLLAGCGSAGAGRVTSGGQPTPGGTLKLLGSGDVDHLDTASAYYTTSYTLVRAPPDAEILRSQPGLGSILATRALTEFGDDPARFAGARSRRNYAANSPITRGSGTRRVVLTRVACNKRLRDALYLQAFATLNASPGARAYYDAHRARGHTHHQALRALANRLVGILDGCLRQPHRLRRDHRLANHRQTRPRHCRLTLTPVGCLAPD